MKTLHISYQNFMNNRTGRDIEEVKQLIRDPELVVHIEHVPTDGLDERGHPYHGYKEKLKKS